MLFKINNIDEIKFLFKKVHVRFIPKYVNQRQICLISFITDIIINFSIILVPMNIPIYLIAILGLENAMLWSAAK